MTRWVAAVLTVAAVVSNCAIALVIWMIARRII